MDPLLVSMGALLLGALGGLLFARGWWLDRFAGNHRRARCGRCWLDAPANACRAGEPWPCPRCNTVAAHVKQLHKVRRNKPVTAVGILLLGGAAAAAALPTFRFVLWFHSMPQAVAAAWWPVLGASEVGRELTNPNGLAQMSPDVLPVLAKQAEEYFADPSNKVLREAFNPESALRVLTVARIRNENAIAMAKATLLPKGSGNDLRLAAHAYLAGLGFGAQERLEVCEAELERVNERFALQRTFDEVVRRANAGDDELLALILELGTRSGIYNERDLKDPKWFIPSCYASAMRAVASGPRRAEVLQKVSEQFRLADTADRRDGVWAAFDNALIYSGAGVEDLLPIIIEVGETPGGLTRTRLLVRALGTTWNSGADKIKELFSSGRPVQIELAAFLSARAMEVPEGSGKYLVKYVSAGDDSVAGRIGSSLGFLKGSDRLLLLEPLRDTEGNEPVRRCIISATQSVYPPLEEAAPILTKLEADQQESQEIRVDARNALRGLKKWPPLDANILPPPPEQ